MNGKEEKWKKKGKGIDKKERKQTAKKKSGRSRIRSNASAPPVRNAKGRLLPREPEELVVQLVLGFRVIGIDNDAINGAHHLTLGLVMVTNALRAFVEVDHVDLLPLRNGLIGALGLTNVAVDAIFRNQQSHFVSSRELERAAPAIPGSAPPDPLAQPGPAPGCPGGPAQSQRRPTQLRGFYPGHLALSLTQSECPAHRPPFPPRPRIRGVRPNPAPSRAPSALPAAFHPACSILYMWG